MTAAQKIPVLAELDRVGYVFSYSSDDEVKGCCPFHDDNTPSCSINTNSGLFKCYACGKSGDIITFLAGLLKTSRAVMLVDLSKRYDIENVKIIEPQVVERYHQALKNAPALVNELKKRGVTDADIRQYRLGEHNGRVTIPIRNAHGAIVNIRKYLPGAPGPEKMRNSRGRGKDIRPFPIEQLEYDTILVCGGEIKAIVAARELNPHGIGAITQTAGENNWTSEFIRSLSGKTVYVCLDIDETGVKAAQELCLRLMTSAKKTHLVSLPLDKDKYPHGDINDFVAEGGVLIDVIRSTPEWKPEFVQPVWGSDNEKPRRVTLSQAIQPQYAKKRVRFEAMVAASARAPYIIPRKVVIKCDRSQPCCSMCPVFVTQPDTETGNVIAEVPRESEAILEIAGASKRGMRGSLMTAFQIPDQCKVVQFDVDSFYSAELVRINPSMDITNRDTDRSMLSAVCVECPATLNETFEFTGRVHPHPSTQEATFVISKSKPVSDALDTYVPKNFDKLESFRPRAWTESALKQKLNEIYADLETNVTRIYQRRKLHLFIDLAYHSPLLLEFDGSRVKGWVEVIIVGDSSQGKTETTTRLMEHYGLGVKVDCKNATVAGLLGGLAKFGESWMVTWGVLPTHDKRLVILEELKGASVNTISKLTDMRSSGIAEIPKIEKRRKHARTRIVALSNARSDRQVDSYGFGIEAIHELIGNPEDVRRFDAGMIVSARDVDASVINEAYANRPVIAHHYTGDLCRELILWSWTRGPDQVEFEEPARAKILSEAARLSEVYTDRVPLIDRGSTRYKLARLSASLACRTFSTNEDYTRVLVRSCHVEFIVNVLDNLYSDETHGYARLSETLLRASTITDIDAVKTAIQAAPFPVDLCENLLYSDDITKMNIQDWTSFDRFEVEQLVSVLVRKRALVNYERNTYRKNPDFVRLLREMLSSGEADSRPDHIEEKF